MKRLAWRNIALVVPVSSSRWLGTVRVSLLPSARTRRNFTWLPRCVITAKPNCPRIEITSEPDRRRSLGMRWFQFHCHHERWIRRQTKICKVFACQVQLRCFTQVGDSFIQRGTLSYHGDFQTFRHITAIFSRADDSLNRALKTFHVQTVRDRPSPRERKIRFGW